MKNSLILAGAILLMLVPLVWAIEAQIEVPETITIDAAQKRQPAVVFPHKAHADSTACDTCHHTQEGLTLEASAEVEACSSCHLDPEEKTTPSMSEMSLKKNPLHVGCVGCHKEEANGPTKCKECHKK